MGDKRETDAEVPADFWWARGQAALEQNWSSGDFETWIRDRIHARAYGVMFRESDIEAMTPSARMARKIELPAEGNYAPASQCVDELCKQFGCTIMEAGQHIVRFSRAFLMQGRCSSVWWQVTDRYGAREDERTNVAIPDWFWENCASGPDAILDWKSGTFAGRGIVDGEMHKVRIRGAEFDIDGIVDLEAMLRNQSEVESDTRDSVPPDNPQTSPQGGRPKSEKWSHWIAELVSYIHDEGIPGGSGVEGQDAIIGSVDERLIARGLEGLGRSTVQPVVRAVLLRLRSAEN